MAVPRELDDFRRARRETLETVAGLAQRQLDFSPARGKWSVGEVLDHLPRVDATYRREIGELVRLAKAGKRPYLKRTFEDIDVSVMHIPKALLPFFEIPFTLSSRLLPRAVGGFMASARFIPIQHPENATPEPGRLAAMLRAGLEDSLAGFETLFGANPDLPYASFIHQHPLFGVNSVPQMLEILLLHERRHQAQVRDLLAHPDFPADEGRARRKRR